MIRAFLLLVNPSGTWDKIVLAQRSLVYVLLVHLVPLMVITLGVEAYALGRLGEGKQEYTRQVIQVTPVLARTYAVTQGGLLFVALLVGARVAQQIGNSFHTAHNYRQSFVTVVYGTSPYFLSRLLDALPPINTWLCFALGVAACIPSFYHGVPRLMRPDPAKAFGLFLTIFLLMASLFGAAHYLSLTVLHDQLIPAMDKILLNFKGH